MTIKFFHVIMHSQLVFRRIRDNTIRTLPRMHTEQEKSSEQEAGMVSLFASPLADELLALDVMAMTPIEAMNELYKLQQKAQKEAGRA